MGNKDPIIDDGSSGKYFFQVPNLIDDFGLSVYAFRLYAHLKRVAGEDGACWQSARTLSKNCKMGLGSITNAKNELIEAGLILIIEKPNKNGRRPYHEIRLVDIWKENFKRYASKASSPDELASSVGELASSPDEQKKNESLRRTLEEALKIWACLFPKKSQPQLKKVQTKWKTRMKDPFFRDNWKKALEISSKNLYLQDVRWFNFRYFIRSEDTFQNCIENVFESFHKEYESKSDNRVEELYPLYTDQ